MRPLTEKEFKAEAEPVLRQVFTIDNPFARTPLLKLFLSEESYLA
jgi:hypothetical protein